MAELSLHLHQEPVSIEFTQHWPDHGWVEIKADGLTVTFFGTNARLREIGERILADIPDLAAEVGSDDPSVETQVACTARLSNGWATCTLPAGHVGEHDARPVEVVQP